MNRALDENTPFLNHDDREESDIIQIIQQRRLSIASVGPDHIPPFESFKSPLNHNQGPSNLSTFHRDPNLAKQRSREFVKDSSFGLAPFRSRSSSIDVQTVLSQSHLGMEPETTVSTELKVLVKYSIPLIVTFLLQYSLTVASVFSVGRLGSQELGAVSLSSMTANISGYAIIQGISTCLDTLCAQSYGRKEFNMVGMHFMRCNYLLLLLYIPIFFLWVIYSESILLTLVGKDQADLCKLASQYLRVVSLGVPGYILFENGKHFLQSQGIFHASTYVLAVCAPINVILNYLLVWDSHIGIGFIGAPLSVVITNYLMFIMLYSYIFFANGYQCWPKYGLINVKYLKNWSRMINLAIPGVLMVEAEWLAFEIITFTASQFGTLTLAAQSIVSTTCVIFYQIPFAMSIASSTRIAWFIGAASKTTAKTSTYASLILALIVGLINGLVLFVFRQRLSSFYSSDKDVIKLASQVLVIGAIYQVNDALVCLGSGVLRGQGRQKIGGWLNLIIYYFIALPMAFYFSLVLDWKLVGLWLGMLIALFILSIFELYFIWTSNWDTIINDCINESLLDSLIIDTHSVVPSMSSSHIV